MVVQHDQEQYRYDNLVKDRDLFPGEVSHGTHRAGTKSNRAYRDLLGTM